MSLGEDTINYTYNSNAMPIKTVYGDITTTYEYDSLGYLTKEEENDTINTYINDIDGNVTRSVAGDVITENTYDTMGRLINANFSFTNSISYTYSNAGRLLSETVDNIMSTTYTYNDMGLTKSKKTVRNGEVLSEYTMTYRPDGNLIRRVGGGEDRTYSYNKIGQLIGENDITYEYD